jgi:hypothetical protein
MQRSQPESLPWLRYGMVEDQECAQRLAKSFSLSCSLDCDSNVESKSKFALLKA